jgi:hypothetical protein
MHNRAGDPKYADIQRDLKARLRSARARTAVKGTGAALR